MRVLSFAQLFAGVVSAFSLFQTFCERLFKKVED
jgi:hypothetical protein